jgi:hypothetical protein
MIMYKAFKGTLGNYEGAIVEVHVDKKTESSVYINGRRRAIRSKYYVCFDTLAEAQAFVIGEAEAKFEQAKIRMERAERNLEKARKALA